LSNKDQVREAISVLLEKFWITRKSHPDEFHFVRKHTKEIQKYFIDNFGYQLFSTLNIIKLEKVPFSADSWMGIKAFSETLDYTIFIATLAYLEERSGEDLFLISMLTNFIREFVTNDVEIKWEVYNHRLSFIRVMKYVEKMDLVSVVEGDVSQYKDNEEVEVLYRPTMLSKYFLRFFTKPIHEFKSKEDMLRDKWINEANESTPKENLQMLNRRLFFSPVVYKEDLSESEKKYFSHQSFRMVETVSEYTDFELEIYRNQLLLVSDRRNSKLDQHPNSKAISDVALHFGSFMKTKIKEGEELPEKSMAITPHTFDKWVEECQNRYGDGWSKEFREDYAESVAKKLLEYFEEWGFAEKNDNTFEIHLYPAIVRTVGEYPNDYLFRRTFVEKVKQINQSSEDPLLKLSIEDFEYWVSSFNEQMGHGKIKGKEAKDAIAKFVTFTNNEDEIIVHNEKIEKEK
jgi:uncharacterized protein (TIGR02678 family)